MSQLSSCGFLLACILLAGRPAGAQGAEPRTYELTLQDALEMARTQAPSVRTARARAGEASGALAGAEMTLRNNPVIEVGAGPRIRSGGAGSGGASVDFDVTVGQEFDLRGERRARVDVARAEIAWVESSVDEVSRQSLGDVARAFLQARYADERLAIATENAALGAELHDVAVRRLAAGDVGALDVDLAALALARFNVDVETAQADRERALGALRRLLGVESDAVVRLSGALLDRERYALAELLANVGERADLRALEAEVQAADAQLRLSEVSGRPRVGLTVGYGREEDAHLATAGVSVSLPVFARGQGLEASALARAEAARIEMDAITTATRSEVRTAHAVYQRMLDAVEGFEREGLPHVERTESLARRGYEAGALQLAELLAIRRELVDARVTYAGLLRDAAIAGVELETQAGVVR